MNRFDIVSREEYEKHIPEFAPRNGFLNYSSYDELKKPRRGTKGSAGYDFFSPVSFKLCPGETVTIPTGIKVKLDAGRVLFIMPRSGHGFKYRVQLDNTIGVIDEDYYGNPNNEGHIFIKITNDSKQTVNKTLEINRGDAFAQGIIMQYELAEEETVTTSRVGGFGSTSNN